jgi:hypothetical protein
MPSFFNWYFLKNAKELLIDLTCQFWPLFLGFLCANR